MFYFLTIRSFYLFFPCSFLAIRNEQQNLHKNFTITYLECDFNQIKLKVWCYAIKYNYVYSFIGLNVSCDNLRVLWSLFHKTLICCRKSLFSITGISETNRSSLGLASYQVVTVGNAVSAISLSWRTQITLHFRPHYP